MIWLFVFFTHVNCQPNDNLLSTFKNFSTLFAADEGTWPDDEGKWLTLRAERTGPLLPLVRIKAIPARWDNVTIFDILGFQQMTVQFTPSMSTAEAFDFVFDRILEHPPKRFQWLQIQRPTADWESVSEVFVKHGVKVDWVLTPIFEETKLLRFINSTDAKHLRLGDFGNAPNEPKQLSDDFFNNPIMANYTNILKIFATCLLTEETLLKMKAKDVTLLPEAPKISLAAARRFLQPALEGKVTKRALAWRAASVEFDEEAFLEGLNVTKIPTHYGSIWTGINGPPDRIKYEPLRENGVPCISLTVCNTGEDCSSFELL